MALKHLICVASFGVLGLSNPLFDGRDRPRFLQEDDAEVEPDTVEAVPESWSQAFVRLSTGQEEPEPEVEEEPEEEDGEPEEKKSSRPPEPTEKDWTEIIHFSIIMFAQFLVLVCVCCCCSCYLKKQAAYKLEEEKEDYNQHKKEQMFKGEYDPKSPVRTSKDSKLSDKPETEEFPQAALPINVSPKKVAQLKASEVDGPTESVLTPENSFVKVREGIDKEQEIQKNLDLELVKLQADEADEEADELTKTSKEKEKAQKINGILRSKSESQARIAAAQAEQNAKLEKKLLESENKIKKAQDEQDAAYFTPAINYEEQEYSSESGEAKAPCEGKNADTPAPPGTEPPETERQLINDE